MFVPELATCNLTFHQIHKFPFHRIAYDYSRADWDGRCDNLKDVYLSDHFREDVFNLSTTAAANEFCEWVQVGIDVYIPHRKYQVKPHSSPWFSGACGAVMVMKLSFAPT